MTDPAPPFDVTPFLHREEGQHFDRKSMYGGPPGKKTARKRRAVRDQVAEYVAAFANAEGGVLILGLEDDGEVTGHALPADAVAALLNTPQERLDPPLAPGFEVEHDGCTLIVFEVAVSFAPVQVVVATITQEADGYASEVAKKLKAAGLQVETDLRNEKINYKVREHSLAKVPVILVVGRREAEEGTVNVRRLGSRDQESKSVDEITKLLVEEATPPDIKRKLGM